MNASCSGSSSSRLLHRASQQPSPAGACLPLLLQTLHCCPRCPALPCPPRNFIAIKEGFEGTWLNPVAALVRRYGDGSGAPLAPAEVAAIPPGTRYAFGFYFSVVTVATLGYGEWGGVAGAAGMMLWCTDARAPGAPAAPGAHGSHPAPRRPCFSPRSGDIVPENSAECLVSCVIISLGVLLFGARCFVLLPGAGAL